MSGRTLSGASSFSIGTSASSGLEDFHRLRIQQAEGELQQEQLGLRAAERRVKAAEAHLAACRLEYDEWRRDQPAVASSSQDPVLAAATSRGLALDDQPPPTKRLRVEVPNSEVVDASKTKSSGMSKKKGKGKA